MMHYMTQFASSASADEGLLSAIGIDWKLLLLQTLAFLILLWFLKKFVYPSLVKMLDEHEKTINEAREIANKTKLEAEKTQGEIEKLLGKARKQATEIVSGAKSEATALIETSDKRSKERAERLIESAREDISKEILSAQKALRDETIDLVALATEKVVGKELKVAADKNVISSAIKEASK